MLNRLVSFRVKKLGLPHLACGLENLEWTEVKQKVHEILAALNLKLTDFSLKNSPVSNKLDADPHPKDLQEAQTQAVDLKQVKTLVLKQSHTSRSQLRSFNGDAWKLWNLFGELTTHNNILFRRFEDPKTSTKNFQQVVPTPLVPEILHSLHSDRTSASFGVTKTLEKLRSRFYWPGQKRDDDDFVGSCLVCQKRNSPSNEHIHRL